VISNKKTWVTKIGLLGLGKMGFPLALNLRDHHFEVIAYDPAPKMRQKAAREAGITVAKGEADLVRRLEPRRLLWLMVPSGEVTDGAIRVLIPHLSADDVVVDGGNSKSKDSVRRQALLKERGVHFLDCGTSGGPGGARRGACTMIGGEKAVYDQCRSVFDAVSVPGGSLYVGGPGAGHFVKMVHNGIEYGMMQAIAEGFAVLEKSGYSPDLKKIADLWQHGSVVRSWLMELAAGAFSRDPRLENRTGRMHASGEGQWTVETAMDLGVPAPVIALSVTMRLRSLEDDTFAGRVVAALRREFGGHAVEKK
jgi:6-phosphogluconate dehydrogenase